MTLTTNCHNNYVHRIFKIIMMLASISFICTQLMQVVLLYMVYTQDIDVTYHVINTMAVSSYSSPITQTSSNGFPMHDIDHLYST